MRDVTNSVKLTSSKSKWEKLIGEKQNLSDEIARKN